MSTNLIKATKSSIKNDIEASYYFDETFKEVNNAIIAYLIQLINLENQTIKNKKKWLIELERYPIKNEKNFQFESREKAEEFLKPLLKKEKELFNLLA